MTACYLKVCCLFFADILGAKEHHNVKFQEHEGALSCISQYRLMVVKVVEASQYMQRFAG